VQVKRLPTEVRRVHDCLNGGVIKAFADYRGHEGSGNFFCV
jgi:hypothetical protein